MTRKTTMMTMMLLGTILMIPFGNLPNASASSIGDIQIWTGSSTSLPSNFLLADGSAVSRTTYADLFAVIGTTFGTGDGSTTFNLPDLVEKFPRGATNDAARGNTGGESTHTLIESELPSHNHTQDAHNHTQNSHNHTQQSHGHGITDPGHSHSGHGNASYNFNSQGNSAARTNYKDNPIGTNTTGITVSNAAAINNAATATNQVATATNQATGGDTAHENKPPYLDIHYIIRYAEDSSSGLQSEVDDNTADIATLQSQITSLNATLNTLDSEVSVIDTLVDYIDTFLNGLFINYDP